MQWGKWLECDRNGMNSNQGSWEKAAPDTCRGWGQPAKSAEQELGVLLDQNLTVEQPWDTAAQRATRAAPGTAGTGRRSCPAGASPSSCLSQSKRNRVKGSENLLSWERPNKDHPGPAGPAQDTPAIPPWAGKMLSQNSIYLPTVVAAR